MNHERTLNILVVEDEDDKRQRLVDSFGTAIGTATSVGSGKNLVSVVPYKLEIKGRDDAQARQLTINIHAAKCHFGAFKVIKDHFLDAALVDLELYEGCEMPKPGLFLGIDVLKKLKRDRPSCRRIIVTANWNVQEAGQQFSLLEPTAHFMFEKHLATSGSVAQALVKSLCGPSIRLENPDEVLKELAKKKATDTKEIRTTADELQYLTTALFSPVGLPSDLSNMTPRIPTAPQAPDMDLASIRLDTFSEEGMSRTAVFHGRPRDQNGNPMLWCVVKIGAQSLILQEFRSYNRYVRYNLSPVRRVELLGFAMADSVGALCYSFAGERPLAAESLKSLLDHENPRVEGCLEVLFDHRESERYWYKLKEDAKKSPGPVKPDGSRSGGFRDRLGYGDFEESIKVLREFPDFAQEIVNKVVRDGTAPHASYLKKVINLGDGHGFAVPDEHVLELDHLQDAYFECIVHGDLHGGNVLVTFDQANSERDQGGVANSFSSTAALPPRVIRIDFAHTGIGPIAHEFAQMETTARSARPACRVPLLQIMKEQFFEREIMRDVWRDDYRDRAEWTPAPPGCPRWARISRKLAWLARMNFFQHNRDFLTKEAYAATCLMCAVQRLRWQDSFENDNDLSNDEKVKLREAVKLRMLVWISHLGQILK